MTEKRRIKGQRKRSRPQVKKFGTDGKALSQGTKHVKYQIPILNLLKSYSKYESVTQKSDRKKTY